jgi:hypothetical protein
MFCGFNDNKHNNVSSLEAEIVIQDSPAVRQDVEYYEESKE